MLLVQDLHKSSVLLKLISRKHIRRLQAVAILRSCRALLLSQRDHSYARSLPISRDRTTVDNACLDLSYVLFPSRSLAHRRALISRPSCQCLRNLLGAIDGRLPASWSSCQRHNAELEIALRLTLKLSHPKLQRLLAQHIFVFAEWAVVNRIPATFQLP